uniref:thymidine kinase n=1 Tax=viral metagenome TaxID=1070528 RepID=A0A6C0CW85_9ZZZZ
MSLEIICGCMFSGKTTEILKIYKKLTSINKSVLKINSRLDNRYSNNNISTHDENKIECISLKNLIDVPKEIYNNSEYIIIDECQFFDDLYNFVTNAVDNNNKHVIIIGLNGDSNRNNFGELYRLYPHADNIKMLKAYCSICKDGTDAIFSKKLNKNDQIIDIGEKDKYIPVCRKCYNKL